MNKQIEALKIAMETMEATLLVGQIPTFAIEQAIQACKEAIAKAGKQNDIEKQLDYAHARGFKEGAENAYKKMEHPTQEPVALKEKNKC